MFLHEWFIKVQNEYGYKFRRADARFIAQAAETVPADIRERDSAADKKNLQR